MMMSEREPGGVLGGGHDGGGSLRWLLTYADLITLMMVFFVVMYSMANVDKQKYAAVAGALRKAFGGDRVVGLPGTGAGEGGGEGPGPGGGVQKDPLMTLAEHLSQVRQKLAAAGELRQGGDSAPLEIFVGARGLTLSLAGSALFGPDSAVIRADALPALAALAETLGSTENLISVEGFEADLGDASFARTWKLSQDRAAAVTRYLIEEHHLPPERFVMVAYGQWHPVGGNDTAAGRAANRRVDVVLLRTAPDMERGMPVADSPGPSAAAAPPDGAPQPPPQEPGAGRGE